MENQSKHCYNCKFLERYYTRGVKRYHKSEFGWCCKKLDHIPTQNCCELFEWRSYPRKKNLSSLHYTLSDLLTEISEVRHIIEDKVSEEEPHEKL